MYKIFLIGLLLIIPGFAQEFMTAEDAIAIGLKNNFDIQVARNNREIAENNKGKGTAEFLPLLDVNASVRRSKSSQESNSPFSFGDTDVDNLNTFATLNWTLFDGFKMFTTNSRFRDLAKLGEFQARNSIENSVVSILIGYLNVVQQEELLEVAQNALEVSQARLEKEKVRQELGSSSSTDYLNAQVSYNNDRSTLLNQELRLLVAKKELNIFLGRDVSTPIAVKKEINISPLQYTVDELQDIALERNSTLSVAEQNKILTQQSISLAEAPFYPRLLFNFNYNYTDIQSETSRFDDPVKSKTTEYAGGLTLTYNLFNGLRDMINRQNAVLEDRNAELTLQDIRNKVTGLVRERYVTMEKRLELMELEEQNVVSATQNLQLQQDKYDIGATTSIEFRDAQVNLIRSQSTLIVARFQARISRLQIEQLIGNIQID
jgi:outer membrane protein